MNFMISKRDMKKYSRESDIKEYSEMICGCGMSSNNKITEKWFSAGSSKI